MMFKLGQKLRKGFAGIDNVFNNNHLPVIKVCIQANCCYYLTRGFYAFIRGQFDKTYFSFNGKMPEEVRSKNKRPVKYGNEQRSLSHIITADFCSNSCYLFLNFL